jgi:hypothetical protein
MDNSKTSRSEMNSTRLEREEPAVAFPLTFGPIQYQLVGASLHDVGFLSRAVHEVTFVLKIPNDPSF